MSHRNLLSLCCAATLLTGCAPGLLTGPSGTTNGPGPVAQGSPTRGQIVPFSGAPATASWLVVMRDLEGRFVTVSGGPALTAQADGNGWFELPGSVASPSVVDIEAIVNGNQALEAIVVGGDASTVSVSPATTLVAQLAKLRHAMSGAAIKPDATAWRSLAQGTATLLASASAGGFDWTQGAEIANANRYAGMLIESDRTVAKQWASLMGPFEVLGTWVGTYDGSGAGLMDGPARTSSLNEPVGLATGPDGLYVAVRDLNQIVRVEGGQLHVVVGAVDTDAPAHEPAFGPDAMLAEDARLPRPSDVAVDSYGNVFFTLRNDPRLGVVYLHDTPGGGYFGKTMTPGKVYPLGAAFDVADPEMAKPFDGQIDQAHFNLARGLVCDGGYLYVADRRNNRVRRVDPAGEVTTVAGSASVDGLVSFNGDSEVSTNDSQLCRPMALALRTLTGGAQELFIADALNNRIRVVTSSDHFQHGTIRTLIGGDARGFDGDGGLAADATIHLDDQRESALALSGDGQTLYFTDAGNQRVRAIDLATLRVRTIAGGGTVDQEAIAQASRLLDPAGLAVVGDDLAIADRAANAVRRWSSVKP